MAELVRYIHLNPVRAKMVNRPEEYPYSGHCAYLGLEPTGILDVDPVLRRFGARKKLAREAYRQFVAAGMTLGHQEEFYCANEGRILGTEEFVDATIHRLGESHQSFQTVKAIKVNHAFNVEVLVEAVEKISRVSREEFCGSGKGAAAVTAKEILMLAGCEAGASLKMLSEITGLSSSAVSRRHEAAKLKVRENAEMSKLVARTMKMYRQRCLRIAESQA